MVKFNLPLKASGKSTIEATGVDHAYTAAQELIAKKFSLGASNLVSIKSMDIYKAKGICTVNGKLSKGVICHHLSKYEDPPRCMSHHNKKCSYKKTVRH